jgi:hypothetical protein
VVVGTRPIKPGRVVVAASRRLNGGVVSQEFQTDQISPKLLFLSWTELPYSGLPQSGLVRAVILNCVDSTQVRLTKASFWQISTRNFANRSKTGSLVGVAYGLQRRFTFASDPARETHGAWIGLDTHR